MSVELKKVILSGTPQGAGAEGSQERVLTYSAGETLSVLGMAFYFLSFCEILSLRVFLSFDGQTCLFFPCGIIAASVCGMIRMLH